MKKFEAIVNSPSASSYPEKEHKRKQVHPKFASLLIIPGNGCGSHRI